MYPRRRWFGSRRFGWHRRYWGWRRPGCWWLLILLFGSVIVCGALTFPLFRAPFFFLR